MLHRLPVAVCRQGEPFEATSAHVSLIGHIGPSRHLRHAAHKLRIQQLPPFAALPTNSRTAGQKGLLMVRVLLAQHRLAPVAGFMPRRTQCCGIRHCRSISDISYTPPFRGKPDQLEGRGIISIFFLL